MTTAIVWRGQRYEAVEGETVLETLERHGIEVGNQCRSGHCCACMLRAENPPPASQATLKETLRASGYFLSCQARPDQDLVLVGETEAAEVTTRVVAHDDLGAGVLRLRLQTETPLDYRPGQFVHVVRDDGLLRSYSLASVNDEPFLELHVRRVPEGRMSGWMHDDLKVDDAVQVRGPFGQCFYVEGRPDSSLLLVGAGTGLAPLYGIVRDALQRDHGGPIHLVHGALEPAGLYHRDELQGLQEKWDNFHVHACALRGAAPGVEAASLDEVARRLTAELPGARAYLCGDPGLVRGLQRTVFLAGLASADILADPFLDAAARPAS